MYSTNGSLMHLPRSMENCTDALEKQRKKINFHPKKR